MSQLHFARSEFERCLAGVSEEDGVVRLEPMNCIGWIVGHVAAQEQFFWLETAQGRVIRPELYEIAGFGSPPTTPPLGEMWAAWREVTAAADLFLDAVGEGDLDRHLGSEAEPARESIGYWLLRNISHYWFHTGEAHAIRQGLGHEELPQFVGNVTVADYRVREPIEDKPHWRDPEVL